MKAVINKPERLQLLMDLPRQRLKAGDIGIVLADYPISGVVNIRFSSRYVTISRELLDPVTDEAPE